MKKKNDLLSSLRLLGYLTQFGLSVILPPLIICNTHNSGLAKGGSGDLLAGLIAGLVASKQCKNNLFAANLGVYLHSQAGLEAKKLYTESGMTIANVAELIPTAWKEFI